jgi:hypothetical protein
MKFSKFVQSAKIFQKNVSNVHKLNSATLSFVYLRGDDFELCPVENQKMDFYPNIPPAGNMDKATHYIPNFVAKQRLRQKDRRRYVASPV